MILIIGGRGAGKRAFALETLGCEPRRTIFSLQDRDPLPAAEEQGEAEIK